MSRKLLKQITNEWRSNLWLAAELLVVSVVMWYVTDFLATQTIIIGTPMEIDADECVLVDISQVPAEAGEYDPSDSTMGTAAQGIIAIRDRIGNHPAVEAVAIAPSSAIPYTQNSWNISMRAADGKDSLITSYLGWRHVSPDYMRVFRIHGAKGETPQEMADVLRHNEALLSANVVSYDIATQKFTDDEYFNYWVKEYDADKSKLIGRVLYTKASGDSVAFRVGGIIRNIKRLEYETPNIALITCIDENNPDEVCGNRIVVRARPGQMQQLITDLNNNATTTFRAGNNYVASITPFRQIRKIVQTEYDKELRNHIVIMLFLMTSIFLGLLGTFWFRTQQRVGEIAIRKVNGATTASVFRRLTSEGLLLLTIATPFAVVCDWLITHYQLNQCVWGWDFFEPARFAVTVVITYLLMALMIVLGILFPARKAMKTEPAIALKDE